LNVEEEILGLKRRVYLLENRFQTLKRKKGSGT